jgi:RNA polymerase sigma-70 factor (ECF subfamily)
LRLQAEMLHLDRRILVRFDYSDLANEALLRAHQQLEQFRWTTEVEIIAWLQSILENRAIDMIRDGQAQKRDVQRERSIEAAIKESSVRLDRLLASPETSPSERVQKEEQLVQLTSAVDALEQDQRQAVIARHLMGLKVAGDHRPDGPHRKGGGRAAAARPQEVAGVAAREFRRSGRRRFR